MLRSPPWIVVLVACSILAAQRPASAALVTHRWNSGGTGTWSTATKWDQNSVPDSGNDNLLKFNALDPADYTSTNDLDDGSGGPFVINRITIEGQPNLGVDRTYTIDGGPVVMQRGPEGEAIQINHSQSVSDQNGGATPTTNLDLDLTITDALVLTGGGSGIFNINGALTHDGTPRQITKQGAHAVRISGDVRVGQIVQTEGTTWLNGRVDLDGPDAKQLHVQDGTLGGTGTIWMTSNDEFMADFASPSTVAPGDGPGSVGTLTFNAAGSGRVGFRNNAVWEIDLGAGGQSDQLVFNSRLFTGTTEGPRLVVTNPGAADGSHYTIAEVAGAIDGGAAPGQNPIAGVFRYDSVIPDRYGVRVNRHSIQLFHTPESLLVYDDFDTKGSSPGDDVSDPTDVPWTASTGGGLSVGTPPGDPPYALKNQGGGSYRYSTGAIPSVQSLLPAEELVLEVLLKSNNAPALPDTEDGYRIGLFGPADTGYFVNIGAAAAGDLSLWKDDDPGSDLAGATGNTLLAELATGAPSIDENDYHRFVLWLLGTGGGVELTLQYFDDPAGETPLVLTATDLAGSLHAFDRILIGTGNHSIDFWVDNVSLRKFVPEPSSMALGCAALAGLALAAWRRRSRGGPARA